MAHRSARCPWLKVGGLVVIAAMLAGCGHKKVAEIGVTTAPPDDSNQAPAPASQATAPETVVPTTVAAAPDGGADLRALNHIYIGWVVRTHQRAKTFEEYVAASGVKVPAPPAGKKYVIDHAGFIAIQNQ